MCEKKICFEFLWEIEYFGHFIKGLKCNEKKLNSLCGKR